jgi:hypothetical protein
MKIHKQKSITTRLLRRREKEGKLEKMILSVQYGEIPLLLLDLLKDKGRLSAYPLLAHNNYCCIVALASSHCVFEFTNLLAHNSGTPERIFISFIIWVG